MKKVLITGIDGFTGFYVKKELESRGYQVVGTSRKQNCSDWVYCDLSSYESVYNCLKVTEPNYIIHLAALSFVAHDNAREFYDINVIGTEYILRALEENNIDVEKVIFSSSANVYGSSIGIDGIDETVLPSPVNHYANSKLAMEHMVKQWFERYPIIITRPFNYTGPGQSSNFLIPKIVSHFKCRKKEIELGNIDVSRDFSDVRDISNAYADLMESDVHSDTFNLCSGDVYSLSEIIEMLEELAGYKIKVSINPEFVRKNEIKTLLGCRSKLNSVTPFTSLYSMKDTLRDMYLS